MDLRVDLYGSTAMQSVLSFIFNNKMNDFHAVERRLTGTVVTQNPLRRYH